MHRLKARLQKLEARIHPATPSWNDYYAEAEKLAHSMLSPTDRDLVADAIQLKKRRGHDIWTEKQRSVWQRFSEAFDRAVAELHIPCSMLAADVWL